jgi:hypothetical protein
MAQADVREGRVALRAFAPTALLAAWFESHATGVLYSTKQRASTEMES